MKNWLRKMTFGETGQLLKLCAWNFFDSFWLTIPYGAMLMAIYFLLIPLSGGQLPLTALWIVCGVLLAQLAGYVFIRRKTYIDTCTGMADTTKNARLRLGEQLRRLPMGFYSRRNAGDLSIVLLRDFNQSENFASQMAPQITVIMVRLLLAVIVLTAFEWRMMLAAVLVIPLAVPFVVLSYRNMTAINQDLMKTQEEAAAQILEYVGGIQTLKAYHMAGTHFAKLKESFIQQRNASVGMEAAGAPVGMIGRFMLSCGGGVVMLLGALLLTRGELMPFYYIAFLLLALNLYEPVMILFFSVTDLARASRSADRINELQREQPLPEPQISAKPQSMSISFDHVSFSYGNKQVLHDISLHFPARRITALVGPSGSGKSTITRLAARFWDVNEGEIRLGGVPVTQLKTDDLLSHISMVFQEVYLFHDTIAANILMGRPEATHEELMAAAQTAACHNFIMALPNGYDTIVGEGGSTLSGGEKQRISIARALLKNAPIVLLDEATASLDPENDVLIQQAISALVAEKTVIVIAHRLQSISNADQIIVLDDGSVKETGSHDELLAQQGLYARLWEEQSRADSWQVQSLP